MNNNIVMRKVVLTDQYQRLSAQSVIASVTVTCPPSNQGAALFKGDDGSDVPWSPSEFHALRGVDLSSIQVKGTPEDIVTVVGGAW